MGNYYRALGLRKDATEEEIKAAYKKMSLAHNPKRYKPRPMLSPSEHAQEQLMREHAQEMESIQIFATISEAFDVLTDPLRKAIYDQFGERALKEGMPGPKGFIPPYAYHGDPYATFRDFFGTDNPFADLLSAACAPIDAFVSKETQDFRPKASPVYKDLDITLAEAYNGALKKIMITKRILTDKGEGTEDKILTITVPPGTPEGLEFNFPAEGDQEVKTSPADLIFVAKIIKHAAFRREGDNLVLVKEVTLYDALCGVYVHVDTLDGRTFTVYNVHVVQPGFEKVIPGEGMPIFGEADSRGNLIIRFKVKYPNKLTQEQKDKLKAALDPQTGGGVSAYDKKPPVSFYLAHKCYCSDDEDFEELKKKLNNPDPPKSRNYSACGEQKGE